MNVYGSLSAEFEARDNMVACKARVGSVDYYTIISTCKSSAQAKQIANNLQSAYNRVLWNDKLKSGFFNETNFA